MVKALKKVEIQGSDDNIIKVIYDRPNDNITLHWENLKVFPLKSGTRQEYALSLLLFNTVFEFLKQ
jgi:hypothetical protein